jgi:hypothetical protein
MREWVGVVKKGSGARTRRVPSLGRKTRLMSQLNTTISQRSWHALLGYAERTKEPLAHIVNKALAEYLQISHHTLYQVSTVTALVEGIYQALYLRDTGPLVVDYLRTSGTTTGPWRFSVSMCSIEKLGKGEMKWR